MNRKQADAFLAKHGYALELSKADGVWYMVNAYGNAGKHITAHNEETCMNCVRLSDITEAELLSTAQRLTTYED